MQKFLTIYWQVVVAQLFSTPWIAARQASLSITKSQSPPKSMSIVSVMSSNHLILCHPLLLLPSVFPSIRIFSSKLALCIKWLKDWSSASASVLPMNIQGCLLLVLTGLISLLSKGLSRVFSITTVWRHQFFSAQPSLGSSTHICTWLLEKQIALTIWAFVGKVMSLLFNTLCRFVIAFLPRSKHLLIFLAEVTICCHFWARVENNYIPFPGCIYSRHAKLCSVF